MDRASTEAEPGVVDVDIADTNYALYRDALSAVLIDKLAEPAAQPKHRQRRGRGKKDGAKADLIDGEAVEPPSPENPESVLDGPDDGLAEFVDYLARETFALLPDELQTLAHHVWADDAALRARYGVDADGHAPGGVPTPRVLSAARVAELLPGLDPSPVADSMQAYGLAAGGGGGRTAADIVAPALSGYLAAVAAAPPPPRSTRGQADGCEICGRDWMPLSYHHLIPRFVHAKAVKRGWHRPDELQNVAWLCGACHRQVHRFASHEDLARKYYTVERLLAEPEMQRFAAWASRLRWKGR